MKKGFYKRSLAAVLAAVMAVGLAACDGGVKGKKDASESESQAASESTKAPSFAFNLCHHPVHPWI